MDSATVKVLIAHRISDALPNFENNRDIGFGHGGGIEGARTLGDNTCLPRACNYKDFMNYKPKPFYRNEGVVGLNHCINKIESVFDISFVLWIAI